MLSIPAGTLPLLSALYSLTGRLSSDEDSDEGEGAFESLNFSADELRRIFTPTVTKAREAASFGVHD